MIQDHTTEIFDIKGAQIYAVSPVARLEPNFEGSNPVGNTTEKIHGPTGVMDARNKLGLTGKGVKVGIIDSGVYYLHPALGGGFGAGFRVSGGHDFVGDDYDAAKKSIPIPDDDPIDNCSSSAHGTHVAGIVAANAVGITAKGFVPAVAFTGAAPNAELAAYRIFGCAGSGDGDIIAASILRAASDGCHIINLSLGGGPNFRETPYAIAVETVSKLGHIVFGSSGNSGRDGLMSSGGPAVSGLGFGVGSADNVEQPTAYMTVGDLDFSVSFGGDSPLFAPALDISNIVINDVDAETNNKMDDGLSPICNPAVSGFPVLIRFGTVGGSKGRCNQAKKCGATHCILYAYSEIIVGIAGADQIPSLFVNRIGGLAIRSIKETGNANPIIVHAESEKFFDVATGGTKSEFSSGGLDNDLFIKPDIVAIGGLVYSTLSPTASIKSPGGNAYGVKSGTSMSSPNAAGIAALYLEHMMNSKKEITFDDIHTKFQNGAIPMKMYNSDLIESVALQGSGLINVYNSIMLQSNVFPSALALNDTIRTMKSYEIEITNEGSAAANYKLTSIGAAFVEPFTPGDDVMQVWAKTKVSENTATVQFSEDSFSVPAQTSKKVSVTFTAPTTDAYLPTYSGYIVVSNDVEEMPIHVPYAGVIGDWSEAPIFSRVSPSIGSTGLFDMEKNPIEKVVNGTKGIYIKPVGATTSRSIVLVLEYTGTDLAVFTALNLDVKMLPSPFLYEDTETPLGAIAGVFQRNYKSKAPDMFIWTGEVSASGKDDAKDQIKLPAGDYKFKFVALKHFKGLVGGEDLSDYDIFEQDITLVYGTTPEVTTTTTIEATTATQAVTTVATTTTEAITTEATTTTEAVTSEATTTAEAVTSEATTTTEAVITTEEPCVGYNCPEATTTEIATTIEVTTSYEETTVEVTTSCEETTVVDITTDGPTETDGSIISGASTFSISSLFAALILII
jgi:subtilisin family serine protease